MAVLVPVYSDENNLHQVTIFEQLADGTFRRTQGAPLRQLKDNIEGITASQGVLLAVQFDQQKRLWTSPTVYYHYGKPKSFYHFICCNVAHNKYFVFTKPNLSGRITRFEVHELKLKQGVSPRILMLLKEKYVESIQLWNKAQYLSNTQNSMQVAFAADSEITDPIIPPGYTNGNERLDAIKRRALALLAPDNHGNSGEVNLQLDDLSYEYTSTTWPDRSNGSTRDTAKTGRWRRGIFTSTD